MSIYCEKRLKLRPNLTPDEQSPGNTKRLFTNITRKTRIGATSTLTVWPKKRLTGETTTRAKRSLRKLGRDRRERTFTCFRPVLYKTSGGLNSPAVNRVF